MAGDRTVVRAFRLTAELLKYLDKRAKERFQTRNALVRQILTEWKEKDERK